MRLDIADSAFSSIKRNKRGFCDRTGKPDESEVVKEFHPKIGYQMPTPESHLGTLSERDIAVIKKWIKQGAAYGRHWAFNVPVKSPLPEIADKKWANNEIDFFTLDRMRNKGLTPNEEADKERLLKRVSLDLTGLPPSIQMMDDFLNDKSPNAYEKGGR